MSDESKPAYFVSAREGSRHEIFPGVNLRAVGGEKLMISYVTLEPGSVVELHSHPHEQMGLLLEGELTFTIGGVTRLCQPGDIWRIPGGVPHTCTPGATRAIAIDIFTPVREEYL
jgi:quercetin dioxygenase-like cupin family protein